MTDLLEVRNLARHYWVREAGGLLARKARLRAVDGVSFSVRPGRTLALVGESGCGKTTTARLTLGLLSATDGEVRYKGAPLPSRRDPGWREMRRQMQMVYQDPLAALDRRLPVFDQVAEPLDIFGEGSSSQRRERTQELMAAVGLPPHTFSRYPHELSGGQRQRVVLARALILSPSLLVCDEPVSALDVSVQAQVLNLLQDVQAQHHLAYLFISHDLKVVRQVSDEVAVMYLGKIVEQGESEDLFRRPAHPYTQALVSAVPSPFRGREVRRIVLQGDPPSPTHVPTGCAFNPRCSHAVKRCREQVPTLKHVGGGRQVACHLVTT